jgi:hypothetical protein
MLSRSISAKAVAVILAGVVVAFAGAVQASYIFSTAALSNTNTDTSCGISTLHTYTHAINFGGHPTSAGNTAGPSWWSPQQINGVAFTPVVWGSGSGPATFAGGTTSLDYGYYSTNGSATWGYNRQYDPVSTSDGGMYNLLLGMMYEDGATGEMVTLNGLTPNTSYILRLYYRPGNIGTGTRGAAKLTFGCGASYGSGYFAEGGGSANTVTVTEDQAAGTTPVAHYLECDFSTVSATSVTIMDTTSSTSNGFRFWGLTNQLAVDVPEPGTLALLAAGLVGLLAYGWRKRK